MADRFWVGGTATWDLTAGTKWATTSGGAGGAGTPTTSDDVFFDAASGAVTCTISSLNFGAKSINCTGFTGTLTGTGTITVAGSITLVAGMTYSQTGTVTVSATGTITSGGKAFQALTLTGTGSTYTLGDALTVTNATTLTRGTLDLNGFTASTGTFVASSTNTRSIAFGSTNIALTSTTAAAVIINMATATNFTSSGTGGFTRVNNANATISIGSTSGSSSATALNFTVTSGAGAFGITAGSSLKNLNLAGATGNVTGGADMYGDITLGSVGFYTGFDVTFKGSGTLNTNTQQIQNLTCDTAGGTVTLGSALSLTAIDVISGNFTTSASNYSISALAFTSTTTNVRTINFNSSTVTLDATAAWSINSTNLTLTGTYNLIFTGNGISFFGGGLSYHNVSFTGLSVTSASLLFNDANSFNTLTIGSATDVGVKRVEFLATQTITTFVCAGGSLQRRIGLYSSPLGVARTLTVGTWTTKSNVDFRNITAAGASAPWSGTSLGDCGGNTSITFDAPKTVYWNLSGANTVFGAGWALTSGGTPSLANQPLAQDTCVFDNTGSVTSTITFSLCNIGTIDMSARTSAMTISVANATCEMYGNWISGSGTTITGAPSFRGASPQSITSGGKNFGNIVVSSSSSVTLQDAFTGTFITLTSGTFNANGFNVTTTTLTSSVNTSGTGTKTLAMGSGTWTITANGANAWNLSPTNLTLTGSATISMTSASNKTFNSTGLTGYANTTVNQGGSGQITFVGSNTFANITNTYSATGATTVLFTGGTTNEFTAFNLTGESGRTCTLGSTSTVQATLRKSGAWNVGANSTNGGNNTGLSFTAGGGIDFLAISYINGVTSGTIYASSVAESASGVDAVSSILSPVYAASIAETASGVDTILSTLLATYAASVAETASGVDAVSSVRLFIGAVTESASGVDTASALAAFQRAVAESSSGVDASSALALLGSTVSETASGIDAATSTAVFIAALLESASGLDRVAPPGSVFNTAVSENIAALDLFSALYLWTLIDDSQTPNWQNVSNAQSPTWANIDDSQTPGWTPINS
jgi:fibronectin-binding autotransporter adhesin